MNIENYKAGRDVIVDRLKGQLQRQVSHFESVASSPDGASRLDALAPFVAQTAETICRLRGTESLQYEKANTSETITARVQGSDVMINARYSGEKSYYSGEMNGQKMSDEQASQAWHHYGIPARAVVFTTELLQKSNR